MRLWDAESGSQTLVLRGHRGLVSAVAFSPDATKLASVSGEGTVRVWALDLDDLIEIARGRADAHADGRRVQPVPARGPVPAGLTDMTTRSDSLICALDLPLTRIRPASSASWAPSQTWWPSEQSILKSKRSSSRGVGREIGRCRRVV